MTGWTNWQREGHIILPLRVFEPVAYCHMRCTQLQATIFDRQQAIWTTRQRDKEIDRRISSTGPNLGPLDPSVGINVSQHWNPTLIIVMVIVITYSIKTIEYKYRYLKSPADDRTTRRVYGHIIMIFKGFDPVACGRIHYMQLQAAQFLPKSDANDPTDRDTERRRHVQISLTGPHWGP